MVVLMLIEIFHRHITMAFLPARILDCRRSGVTLRHERLGTEHPDSSRCECA